MIGSFSNLQHIEETSPAVKAEYKTDPVSLSVVMHRFQTISKEMGITMERTSRSPLLSEARDFSCAIFDGKNRLIAQEEEKVIPIHLAAAGFAVESVAQFFEGDIRPGDVMVINDPYSGGNHLGDWTILSPVFQNDRLIFWTSCRAHHIDVGGGMPGTYNPYATEIYQEGLRIPPLKIYESGELRKDVFNLLLKNVRYERVQRGDLRAQIGAVKVGEKRLLEFIDKYGSDALQCAIEDLLDYTEKRMRKEIESIPDGTYCGESIVDDDGHGERSILIKVNITVNGSNMKIDFTGSHRQVRGFINSSISNTYSSAYIAVMSAVDPTIPHNEGCYRPIEIIAPEGTIVNALFPAPVAMCTVDVASEIIEACWKALSQAVPKRVSAGWDRCCSGTTSGVDPRDGEPYAIFHLQYQGGAGAIHGMDGWHHLGPVIGLGGQTSPSIEMTEVKYPFLTLEHQFRPDSCGAGKWRGGLGVVYKIMAMGSGADLMLFGDGMVNPPFALLGGKPGEANKMKILRKCGEVQDLPSKGAFRLDEGDVWVIESAGGGGVGCPEDRTLDLVLEDFLNGYITAEFARREYKVEIDPVNLEINEERTKRLRSGK